MKKMSTAADSTAQEKEKTWKWIEARVWQNSQSGVYYERPTVKGRPTFRSLKTCNRKHAVEELFKRRTAVGTGEDPYAEPKVVTVGEVIHRYQADGYLDRDLQPRPRSRSPTRNAIATPCSSSGRPLRLQSSPMPPATNTATGARSGSSRGTGTGQSTAN